ncbi:zinc finger and SCAN domain-containing protein 5 [Coprinopsis cinerea AmutBmut pab1-1]|nr:zinc finger and SCAN domain-containing protein 5 [Coprinopsis cinerea AmutBmut pab1-1]
MDSPSSSSKTVSLPSIHEMFPEHIERAQNKNDLKEVGSKGKSRESSERSSRSPKGSPSSRHSEPSTSRGRPVTNEGPHDVSFDVLRSDPSSSSLQHLTSSTTYPNRGAALTYQSGAGVERGSAPAFRVSVSATPPPGPPSDASSAAPPSTSSQPRGNHNLPADMAGMHINDPQQQARSAGTNNHNGSTSYPSIISFPVSGQRPHSGGPLASQEDNVGNGSEEEGANEASSGKKHVCPTCFKRFNRPSSLRIHVNTHTGATPFRCPWPNCGREFNVNSNMRRHYRNHASPGFARQPTEIRRRRRRIDNSMLEGHPPHLNAPHLAPMRRVSDPYGRSVNGYPGSDESDGYDSDYGKHAPRHDDLEYDLHPAAWSGSPHAMPRAPHERSSRSSTASIPPHHYPYHHRSPHHSSRHPEDVPHQYQYPPPPPGYGSHHSPPPPPSHYPPHRYSPSMSYHHDYPRSPRHHPYPLPGTRSYTPAGSSFHSSSPSPSPSPPLHTPSSHPSRSHSHSHPHSHPHGPPTIHKEPIYTASNPYLRTVTENRIVSTTLRPAFASTPARAPEPPSSRHSYSGRT